MGCRSIQLPRSRPAGEQQPGDGKRLRMGPSAIAVDPVAAGARFMDSLGQPAIRKLQYTHPPTGKKYTRAVFAAA